MKKIDLEQITDTQAHTKRLTITAGNELTSPPVRRRDQFPACRSTRSVPKLKALSKFPFTSGSRRRGLLWEPRTYCPSSTRDGENGNAIRNTRWTGVFLNVGRPAQFQTPNVSYARPRRERVPKTDRRGNVSGSLFTLCITLFLPAALIRVIK